MTRLNLALTGDSMITMRHSVHNEPSFVRLVRLLRRADFAFTNLETAIHDYDGWPSPEPGGTFMRSPPFVVDELQWLGVKAVSTANNHSLDYMYGGLRRTIQHMSSRGLVSAGTGMDLGQARCPAYVDTGAGRVGLIAAASTFAPFGRAGPSSADLRGRPGLNPLRFETICTAERASFDAIAKLAEYVGWPSSREPGAEILVPGGTSFRLGRSAMVTTLANTADVSGNLDSVREAARQADCVLFSLHAHEGQPNDARRPANFVEDFARKCIDAGAHIFVGHGPHVLRGIEIRKGRPIFYSLGNFIYQNMTVSRAPAEFYESLDLDQATSTPADAFDARQAKHPAFGGPTGNDYWRSVVAKVSFEAGRVRAIALYPIELGASSPRSQRGRPKLAGRDEAQAILTQLQRCSAPYGTRIIIRNGIGTITV